MADRRYVLVLARSPQQAAQYARRARLERFNYRAVSSASSITGVSVADVHVLSDFHKRPDSHAILSKLRYGRDIQFFEVEMPEPTAAEPVDQGDGMGEQLTLTGLLATTERPPLKHKSVDPDVTFTRDDAPNYADPEKIAAAEDREATPEEAERDAALQAQGLVDEPVRPAEPKKRRSRCKVCGRSTYKAFAVDPSEHDAGAHEPAPADVF